MEKLEELLPGIETFLRSTLAAERLSSLAEQQRLYYVERLDIIQLPPHLPPKPDGEKSQMQGRKLPEPGKNKSDDDFIAHQRAISRQALNSEPQLTTFEDNPVPNNGLGIDSDQYEDGLYEEPVPMEDKSSFNQPLMSQITKFDFDSDACSSTSYESYEEPDIDEPYNNIGQDGQVKTDIPLPRLKTKRKKKPASIHDRYYKQLHSIVHEGELYHRGKVAFTSAWTKRYCAICDGIFYCYKDKDSKPIVSVTLIGYDVILQEKEKGRCNVLRLSHPGCETHFISTDSASETQIWMNRLEAQCYAPTSDAQGDAKSYSRTGSISSTEFYAEGPGSLGANGSPTQKSHKMMQAAMADGRREKKGKIGKFISETFGKKKGRAAAHQLEISEGALVDRPSISSPDVMVAGVVKLLSPILLSDDVWHYKNCAIRSGVFECYKDDSTSSDLEFSLPLSEYELSPTSKNSLSIAVMRQSETAFYIEPTNRLEQGDWLTALAKCVGNGMSSSEARDPDDLAYTYVDSRSIGSAPSDILEVQSLSLSLNESAENDRQYADLSDRQSDSSSSDEADAYDEPPFEPGDRQSKMYLQGKTDSLTRLFARGNYNNLYEEVAETFSPSSSLPVSNRSSAVEAAASGSEASTEPAAVTTSNNANIPSMSRESSCSSEGKALTVSETIAKTRAKFENSSSSAAPKWPGYKPGGVSNSPIKVKRTPSLGSTASTKSTPNSAASSPKTQRANPLTSGNVDRYKAAFEAREANNNNVITDKQIKSPPSISPIRVTPEKEDNTPPPKFTSIFNVQTKANNSKPTKLEIKSVTPSPYPLSAGSSADGKMDFDSALRFDIELSSTDAPITVSSSRLSSTLPASPSTKATITLCNASPSASPRSLDMASMSPGAARVQAKSFLTSTLQRFTGEDSSKSAFNGLTSSSLPTCSEDDEQKRLNTLRQALISLRKERQKVRDQKLSTVLPEDIERLNCEYKRIDADYKSTDKEIKLLEERMLQRIKSSIETRRMSSERNKRKVWESCS
ncbi:serine-rich adhesin for platelets-like isoform X6 [Watersipora subatra]|uniref:serine-rich adhesin for platelets-like isoform X6 n=1 Tax=Watersipora subatra TaxID=2589382 RepID=UPI00355C577D